MKREVFAKVVKDSIWGYLPKDIRESGQIIIKKEERKEENDFYGLSIDRKEKGLVPILDLEPYYEEYERAHNIERIVMDIAKKFTFLIKEGPQVADVDFAYENIKDKLVFKVINMQLNKEKLKELVYTPIASNLAMTYHIKLTDEFSIPVTENIKKTMGYEEENLFNDSKLNSESLNPATLRSLGNAIDVDFNETDCKEGIIIDNSDYKNDDSFVLSNRTGVYGASVLFSPNVLENVGKLIDDDFYAIPASVHEFLIIPKRANFPPEFLTDTLRDANFRVVDREDILYDKIFNYDRESKSLSIVNPIKERGREDCR